MVCAVLLGLLTQVPASSSTLERQEQERQDQLMEESSSSSSSSLQQLLSLMDYLQNRELELSTGEIIPDNSIDDTKNINKNNNKLKELAQVYEKILRQTPDEPSQRLQSKKRAATYMSLCHFKICNMGRKRSSPYGQTRNLRANVWPLNWLEDKSAF